MANHPNRSRRKPALTPSAPRHDVLVIQMAFVVNGHLCEVRKELRRDILVLAAEDTEACMRYWADELIRETLKEARRSGWLVERKPADGTSD